MAEPTSTGGITLTVFLITLLGPFAGPYAVIVMASLLGAMWPLSVMPDMTKKAGAFFLLRVVSTAVVLSTSASYFLEAHYGFPVIHGMSVVAFAIGAFGNGWNPVFSALRQGAGAIAKQVVKSGKDET